MLSGVHLPSEILHLIFAFLTEGEQLCLALTSSHLWEAYLATSPRIPNLWSATPRESQSSGTVVTVPLGALLATWMGPHYREVRPDPAEAKEKTITSQADHIGHLPPFFIKASSHCGELHEGDLFTRYKLYHASAAVRKPFLLPHPRNRGGLWLQEAKMAIVDDIENFRDQSAWERYWRRFRWKNLKLKDYDVARRLVEEAIGELGSSNVTESERIVEVP